MNSILVLCGPGLGHYVPVAGLVQSLQPAPNRVTVMAQVSIDSPLAERVAADGYEFLPLRGDQSRSFGARAMQALLTRLLGRAVVVLATHVNSNNMPSLAARATFAVRSLLRPFPDIGATQVRLLRDAIGELDPVLVLADSLLAGPVPFLCTEFDVDWSEVEIGPVNYPGVARPVYPSGAPPQPRGVERLVNAGLWQLSRARSFARSRALERAMKPHDPPRPPLARLAFSYAQLDVYRPEIAGTHLYIGIPGRLPPQDLLIPNTSRRTIFITLGSTGTARDELLYGALVPALVEIRNRFRLDVVIQVQDDRRRDLVQKLCTRCELDALLVPRSTGPLHQILATAALVVSHGGHGTVLESLACGSPVLLIADVVADRMEVARRVLEAGVGRVLNTYRLVPDVVEQTISEMLQDRPMRERARNAATQITLVTASGKEHTEDLFSGGHRSWFTA